MPGSNLIVVYCKGCDGQVFANVAIDEYVDAEVKMILALYASSGHKIEVIERENFKLCYCSNDNDIVVRNS
jgi:hypothetical protein